MIESAFKKLENLKALQEIQEAENYVPVSVDEDGFYFIGEMIFSDFKSALRYLKK